MHKRSAVISAPSAALFQGPSRQPVRRLATDERHYDYGLRDPGDCGSVATGGRRGGASNIHRQIGRLFRLALNISFAFIAAPTNYRMSRTAARASPPIRHEIFFAGVARRKNNRISLSEIIMARRRDRLIYCARCRLNISLPAIKLNQKALTRGRTDHFSTENSTNNQMAGGYLFTVSSSGLLFSHHVTMAVASLWRYGD